MSVKNLKQLLRQSLGLEMRLYHFCIAALERIYGENSEIATMIFEISFENYHVDGSFRPFHIVDEDIKDMLIKECE